MAKVLGVAASGAEMRPPAHQLVVYGISKGERIGIAAPSTSAVDVVDSVGASTFSILGEATFVSSSYKTQKCAKIKNSEPLVGFYYN